MIDQQIKGLNSDTPTEVITGLIDSIKKPGQRFNTSSLVELLSERHPIYKNRSSIASSHIRGYLIEAFHTIGMPQKGLPYILEELETSFSPYIVAAAAKAVRGIKEPHSGIVAFLNKSIYNIWQADAIVNYSSFLGPYDQTVNTTALKEIFKSLQWLEGKAQYVLPDLYHLETQMAEYFSSENRKLLTECIETIEKADASVDDCCTLPIEVYNQKDNHQSSKSEIALDNIMLQDHEGNLLEWNDYFKGKYTVLSFFYTKCHNPRKCIQTIYNLANIQKKIKASNYSDIQTAAITYDPTYDTSSILKSYGNNRNYHFDESNRMFRVTDGMRSLIENLDIGVNYKGAEVNVHRIEVYIINPEGKIERSFLRFQAEDNLIMDALEELVGNEKLPVSKKTEQKSKKPTITNRLSTIVLPILIAFFPKCPMCWMAYFNLIGISSIVSVSYQPWLVYAFAGLAIFNLVNLYRLSKKRNGLFPFYLALVGMLLLGLNYWLELGSLIMVLGFLLTLTSTLLSSLSFKQYHKISHFINEKWISLKYA
ncbi:hypothetical protein ASG22_00720 [Chryseobacterium sp. Leaf405]|uniref:SCO family protein n=1 Tax=Chryseobacterium sp. Leaf405 TaxID=1736367 RepID=UPI0006FB9C04|nr:SCO family protein [Chryseobacterium sp. Leaf405]KQT35587.1 hypothetical protein ASG22_00720 [Chryseobacterium sp. Leaf405]